MMQQEVVDLQNKIVSTFAKAQTQPWDSLVCNIEIDVIDGDRRENCLALQFVRNGEQWQRDSIQISDACYDLFVGLQEKLTSPVHGEWKSCTLEVNSSGKYQFSFSYERPRRLYRIHDDVVMLKGYVPSL